MSAASLPPGSRVTIAGSPPHRLEVTVRTTSQILSALHEQSGDDTSLPQLLCLACSELLDLTGAAMSVVNDDGIQAVVGASGPVVEKLERVQLELGEGPAVDASRENRPSFHPHLDHTATELWPAFAPAALDAGIQALFALPLQAGAVRLGSLVLYRSIPGSLDEDAMSTALAYAEAAVVVFLHLQAQMLPDEVLHPELAAPLDYHSEVHQATGFLSVQASVKITEALLLLRASAFANERPLLQVAREVLAGRLRLQPEGDQDG